MKSTLSIPNRTITLRCLSWNLALLLLAIGPAAPAEEKAGSPPQTHTAKKGTLTRKVELDGVFESRKMARIQLDPQVWSDLTVVDVVDHGERVKKGDVLLRLKTEKLEEQIAEMTHQEKLGVLTLEMTAAELENLEKSVPLQLESARREKYRAVEDFDYFESTDREQREKSARFGLKSSEQRLANAREELAQLEQMYRADDLTEETEEIILERQKFAVEAAEFGLENTKLSTKRSLEVLIPRMREDLKSKRINQELSQQLSEISLPNSLQQKKLALAKMKRDREQSAEKLADLKKDKQWAVVRAPMDGIVYYGSSDNGKWTTGAAVAKKLVEGGKLAPKEVLMTVVNPQRMQLKAVIAEKDLARLSEGTEGHASPVAMPERKLPVEIEEIALVPEPSGGFPAVISVRVPKSSRLVPGMNSKIKFATEVEGEGVLVPQSALIQEGDKTFVKVLDKEGKPSRRQVETGASGEEMVDVTEGLESGEKVLVNPEA